MVSGLRNTVFYLKKATTRIIVALTDANNTLARPRQLRLNTIAGGGTNCVGFNEAQALALGRIRARSAGISVR